MSHQTLSMLGLAMSSLAIGFAVARVAKWNDTTVFVAIGIAVVANLVVYAFEVQRGKKLRALIVVEEKKIAALETFMQRQGECPTCGRRGEPATGVHHA